MKLLPILAAGFLMLALDTASTSVAQGRQGTTQAPVNNPTTMPDPISSPSRGTPSNSFPSFGGSSSDDSTTSKLAEQQARTRNGDRQKKIKTDTDRLLALATDLKEQVDKTDKNILSIDVIKKAEEIEKLAKSVKERMKG
jgi:hypothetical protein